MTPEEYNENIKNLYGLVSGNLAEDTILVAGNELLIQIKNRITNEGRTTNDKAIGQYSTKPIYVSKNQFVNGGFQAVGKTGKLIPTVQAKAAAKLTFGNKFIPFLKPSRKVSRYTVVTNQNKPHVSMYLPNGYRQLRDIQGLRTDIVNLKYRGDLINSYQSQLARQSVLLGLISDKEALKREGLENRYGNVFYASEQEKETYIRRTNYLLNRLTRNTLSGFTVEAEII